jgi:hypothetical protein
MELHFSGSRGSPREQENKALALCGILCRKQSPYATIAAIDLDLAEKCTAHRIRRHRDDRLCDGDIYERYRPPRAAQVRHARDLKLQRYFNSKSVQSSSFLHRSDLDVVLWKLIFELQAFPQRINKTSMMRSYSSVDSDDIVLTMSRDSAFHGTPHKSPPQH